MSRYKYMVITVILIASGNENNLTSWRISNRFKKIDFVELFKTAKNSVPNISFVGNKSELSVIISVDTGIYQKTISGAKLEKVFNRLTKSSK